MASEIFTVGLTGGIGTGKTTVSNAFRQLGVTVIDADEISREIMQPGTEAWREIVAHFGPEYLLSDQTLNRARLRERVFRNPEDLTALEQATHPRIRQLILERRAQASSPYVILSIPLLLESSEYDFVNRVLVTDCNEETQIRRVCQRDLRPAEEVKAIMAKQTSRQERLRKAHDIISSEQPQPAMLAEVKRLHEYYLSLAQRHAPRA